MLPRRRLGGVVCFVAVVSFLVILFIIVLSHWVRR